MDVKQANERLSEISKFLFGNKAELRVVPAKSLKLLKKNARYMEKHTFDQLTDNIKSDGFLASAPLAVEEKGKLTVLSGNHRVKGTIEAGIDTILVIVDKRKLSNSKKVAIQLSHNSLTGKDDEAILAGLWKEIDNMAAKLYAGLDSKVIEKLENEKYMAFNAQQIPTKQMTFWFIPSDIEKANEIIENATSTLIKGDSTHVVTHECYERIVNLIIKVKKTKNIKNSAIAFQEILAAAEKYFAEVSK